MPFPVYTLDSAIEEFFSGAGAASSRAECDEIARQRCGGEEVQPVAIQGSNSYTVIAGPSGDKIVQFREETGLLDMHMLELAKDIHGDVVASCSELGWVGGPSGSRLAIYEMDRLPGDNYITTRSSLTAEQKLNTVHSLARFFAQSWQKSVPGDSSKSVDMSAIRAKCYARFEYLARSLPERFLPAVAEVQAALPDLFDGHYPVVLTHSDLNEMNILVDPDSGKITGVVDWADASIQPFGFALYALENALGSMGSGGWKWFDDADDLRDAFWKAFSEQIGGNGSGLSESQARLAKLAGRAGILIHYGNAHDSGSPGMIETRDPKTEDFRYLDALLL